MGGSVGEWVDCLIEFDTLLEVSETSGYLIRDPRNKDRPSHGRGMPTLNFLTLWNFHMGSSLN